MIPRALRRGAPVLLAALLCAGTGEASTLSIQPHLGELRPDGFVIAFETEKSREAEVELARRQGEVLGPFERAGRTVGTRHRVRITGLAPDEQVRYRVVVAGRVVAEANARSGPADTAQALDFVVYGDTRDGEEGERAVVIDALAGAPRLLLHTGDVVRTGGEIALWQRFFEVEHPLLGEIPLYLAVGNHELYDDERNDNVRRLLPLPDPPGSRDGEERSYYTFRVGPARFIALDSNRIDAAQTRWLERTLLAAETETGLPHVFVFLHHPPFSTGGHCGAGVSQLAWIALLEAHPPTAVFAGHDHAYERLERNGVRYFVTGGGGAPLYEEHERCPEHDHRARRVYRAEHHLLRVKLRGAAVEIEVARPGTTPIEVVRYGRGDPLPESVGPSIVDERKPTGFLRPSLLSALGATVLGLVLVLVTTRRRRRAA